MRLDLQSCDLLEPLGSREVAWVTISRRNLVSLLHKLGQPAPQRTIVSLDVYRDGKWVDDLLLVVQAEDDSSHRHGRGQEQASRERDAFLNKLVDRKENDG